MNELKDFLDLIKELIRKSKGIDIGFLAIMFLLGFSLFLAFSSEKNANFLLVFMVIIGVIIIFVFEIYSRRISRSRPY